MLWSIRGCHITNWALRHYLFWRRPAWWCLAMITAPHNSSLGIVTHLIGAPYFWPWLGWRVRSHCGQQPLDIYPGVCWFRGITKSMKLCGGSIDFLWKITTGMRWPQSMGSSPHHLSHVFHMAGDTGASQSSLSSHSLCNSILSFINAEEHQHKMSYKWVICERSVRLVRVPLVTLRRSSGRMYLN